MSIDDIANRELSRLAKVIEEHKSPFTIRLLRSKLALIVIAVLVFLFQVRGLPDKFANQSLDAAVAVQRHEPAGAVSLVVINDNDYRSRFSEISPLNSEIFSNLLEAIAAGGAKALVIDIETSSPRFLTMKVPSIPTVWAMVASRNENGTYTVSPPLGGRALPVGSISAVALVPNDDRGIVRGYRRIYQLLNGEVAGSPGYALAHLLKSGGQVPKIAGGQNDRYLDFRYDFSNSANASDILKNSTFTSWHDLQTFKDRIVVVGATYSAARDRYATPAGPRFGCEIVAHEVQAELDETSVAQSSRWLTGLFLVLGGLATVALYHCFNLRVAFVFSLMFIPLLSIASNWILFHRLSAWGAMVPLVSAVIIAELYAEASLYLDLLKKLSAVKSRTESEPVSTDDSDAIAGPS
ncbi:MAG: CHASE2 domain-containing protein [Terracidiphilus sp.]|jgi:CHASE2 domain-containing sensor protein